ncbi:TPA: hypothetical protein HA251_05965, partial [Candidatus Woesearchaeota archaeon]|nr:hypothetical protein [Candidatus Woesearchaeota archaeon]
MADEFHTQPIDVPPELLHPATTQGVEGQQVYRDPDVMATLSRLRSAPSQVQVAGIDLLRATPAKPLDNDPFASLRESKKNDVPQLLPTAQPDQLAVIPTISVHDAPLSADDLSYELEITSMIER